MPGTIGNTNSSRNNRLWADTIRRACLQADGAKLRAIADKLIEKAAEGDISAIRELGDRLDGKSVQGVELTGAEGGAVEQLLTVKFVDSKLSAET